MEVFVLLLNVASLCHTVSTKGDVRLPPTISKSSGQDVIFYRKYDNVTLECVAEGNPYVRYEWKKNGFEIDANLSNILKESNGTMTINRATISDEGYYQCLAKNPYGTAVSVVIEIRMSFIDASTGPSTVLQKTVVEGMPVRMQAYQPRFLAPIVVYTWMISPKINEGFALFVPTKRKQFAENGDLYFAYALPEDVVGGKFYRSWTYNQFLNQEILGSATQLSVTKNPAGNISESAPTLAFSSEAHSVVLIGQDAKFRCFFYGYPEPAIGWSAPRHLMLTETARFKKDRNNTELTIARIRPRDQGEYKCRGLNANGQLIQVFQLRVEDVPRFRSPKDGPYNVNVTEGTSVTFNCSASALPAANNTWLQDGKVIDTNNPPERFAFSNDTTSLTIVNVCRDCVDRETKTDLMVIQCNASNAHGYAFAQGYLNVFSKTNVTIRGPRSVSVDFLEEKQFVFQCHATSDPSTPPTTRWYKTEPFDHLVRAEPPYVSVARSTLVVRFDGNCSSNCAKYLGEYRCIGDNGYSQANSTIIISYQQKPPPEPISQDDEALAEWKIYLGVGAIGVVLLLIGIFFGFRSRRFAADINGRTNDQAPPNLANVSENSRYEPANLPLAELAEQANGSTTRSSNMYERIRYDSNGHVLNEQAQVAEVTIRDLE